MNHALAAIVLSACAKAEPAEDVLSQSAPTALVYEVASIRGEKSAALEATTDGSRAGASTKERALARYKEELPHILNWAIRYSLEGFHECDAEPRWKDGACTKYYHPEDPQYPTVGCVNFSIDLEETAEEKTQTRWAVNMPIDNQTCTVQWTQTLGPLTLKEALDIHCLGEDVYSGSQTLTRVPGTDLVFVPEADERVHGNPWEVQLFKTWFDKEG